MTRRRLKLFDQLHKERGPHGGNIIVEVEFRMVKARTLASAQKQIGPGAFFEHIGEILGSGDTGEFRVDMRIAHDSAGHIGSQCRLLGGIHGAWIPLFVIKRRGHAVTCRLPLNDRFHPRADQRLYVLVESSHSSVDHGGVRDDVAGRSGVDLRHRNHMFLRRQNVPA